MAFNFNWTPLSTTSSEFYTRAKDLLTTALNKAPKPPIIVDDIIVEELNLGSTAPELEILEIGDLAEDRFRGIFKVSYRGDAELTLRTKVQANPLSTYLSTTPSFTSPCPLAASAPLTIPLQITLSEFRLSGFVILVFSKAKGITLVFRNDPLESLRVSSTFDSIPFIKDYLQKEIERVVRGLFQEELPVGIHRLSLKWFNPEYAASLEAESGAASTQPTTSHGYGHHHHSASSGGESDDEGVSAAASSPYINPLAPSPDEPNQQQFSQKHMAQLEALFSSQKTLSVLGATVKEAVFRANAAPSVVPAWSNGGVGWTEPPGTPSAGGSTTYTFNEAGDAVMAPRPGAMSSSLSSLSVSGMGSTGASVSGGRLGRGRRKKHRVVNLRKKTDLDGGETASVVSSSDGADLSGSTACGTSTYSDEYSLSSTREGSRDGSVFGDEEEELLMQQQQQQQHLLQQQGRAAPGMRRSGSLHTAPPTLPSMTTAPPMMRDLSLDSTGAGPSPLRSSTTSSTTRSPLHHNHIHHHHHQQQQQQQHHQLQQSATASQQHDCACTQPQPPQQQQQSTQQQQQPPNPWLNLAAMVGAAGNGGSGGGSILEQAVLMKLASEVARLQAREKEREMERERERARRGGAEVEAPPAYGA
ncbi:mitochondrial distribution and morphology protein 34 [Peziza echinospora]|nr:mitochondrial distribution and morphology protein 34 [Peziza echinospora]